MKKCEYCRIEIDQDAKICPSCKKKQHKLPKKIRIIIVLLLVIMIIAMISSGGSDEQKTNKESYKPESKENFSYTVEKSYTDEYNFGYYIEGVVTNNKDKDYSYVEIEFICYDEEGNNLGTAIDNTNNLLGKETWKYKAMAMFSEVESVDHCDFNNVEGW